MAGKRSRESKKRKKKRGIRSYFAGVTSLDHLENSHDVREQDAAEGREIPKSSGAV